MFVKTVLLKSELPVSAEWTDWALERLLARVNKDVSFELSRSNKRLQTLRFIRTLIGFLFCLIQIQRFIHASQAVQHRCCSN